MFLLGLLNLSDNVLAGPIPLAFAPCPTTTISGYSLGTGLDVQGYCAAQNSAVAVVNTGVGAMAAVDLATTQETSLLKQAEQYAQEVLTVQNLVIQTEMLIKDLEENPLQVIAPDVNQIIANQERIDRLAQDINKNSSKVGSNLIKNLEHPNTIGLGQGSKFQLWSDARVAAVNESYDKVTGFMVDLKKKNLSISQAIYNINHATGKTATVKATANAAGQQLSMLQDMKELLMQMLGMQAVENGAKLQADNDAAESQALTALQGLGQRIVINSDTYKGPGTSDSGGF